MVWIHLIIPASEAAYMKRWGFHEQRSRCASKTHIRIHSSRKKRSDGTSRTTAPRRRAAIKASPTQPPLASNLRNYNCSLYCCEIKAWVFTSSHNSPPASALPPANLAGPGEHPGRLAQWPKGSVESSHPAWLPACQRTGCFTQPLLCSLPLPAICPVPNMPGAVHLELGAMQ